MKLFVTGGAGFIGSNYVRHVLAHLRRRGHRVRRADLRRQPRQPPRPRRRPAVPVRQGRHLRPRRGARGDGRPRRRRALRGREPRRPLDRSAPTSSSAPTATAPTSCATSPASVGVERFLHISTDEVYGSIEEGSFTETDRARAALAVLGVEGRLRPDRALVPHDLRAPGGGHPVVEQLRAVPVPREGHPAVRHQPARRREGPALRRRPQRARLVLRRRQLRAASTSCCARGRSARSTTSAPATRCTNRELTDAILGIARRTASR